MTRAAHATRVGPKAERPDRAPRTNWRAWRRRRCEPVPGSRAVERRHAKRKEIAGFSQLGTDSSTAIGNARMNLSQCHRRPHLAAREVNKAAASRELRYGVAWVIVRQAFSM